MIVDEKYDLSMTPCEVKSKKDGVVLSRKGLQTIMSRLQGAKEEDSSYEVTDSDLTIICEVMADRVLECANDGLMISSKSTVAVWFGDKYSDT